MASRLRAEPVAQPGILDAARCIVLSCRTTSRLLPNLLSRIRKQPLVEVDVVAVETDRLAERSPVTASRPIRVR